MATFSSFFTATIYGTATTWDSLNQGWQTSALYRSPSYQAFPKNGIKLWSVSPAMVVTNAGVSVTINSIVEVLPTGLGFYSGIPQSVKYLTDSTFAQLYTNGA